jgi:hypothetical protein
MKGTSEVVSSLKHNVMTTHSGIEVKLHAIFSALGGSERSVSHSGRLHQGRGPQISTDRRSDAPKPTRTVKRNIPSPAWN